MCLWYVWVQGPMKKARSCWIPWNLSYRLWWATQHRYWEQNSSLLHELYPFFTAETSAQSLCKYLVNHVKQGRMDLAWHTEANHLTVSCLFIWRGGHRALLISVEWADSWGLADCSSCSQASGFFSAVMLTGDCHITQDVQLDLNKLISSELSLNYKLCSKLRCVILTEWLIWCLSLTSCLIGLLCRPAQRTSECQLARL